MSNDILSFQKDPNEAGLRLVGESTETGSSQSVDKQFISFMFLRVNPQWRQLQRSEKDAFKAEFEAVFDGFRDDFLLYSYSLVGFDSKADLMLWRIGLSLDSIQDMTARLYRTRLGSYLETSDNYLSVTKKMMFVDEVSDDRRRVHAGGLKYHFVYPCAKQNEWYKMTPEERDTLVEENFMVGKRFPNIRIHLTHAFGFTEHEYLVSFETDEPRDFLALAEELRQSPASKFTIRGMPVYTCRLRTLSECIDALG